MKISEIKAFPTVLGIGEKPGRYHESLLRSYQILEKTKTLLNQNAPVEVILEIIEEIETAGSIEKDYNKQTHSAKSAGG